MRTAMLSVFCFPVFVSCFSVPRFCFGLAFQPVLLFLRRKFRAFCLAFVARKKEPGGFLL